MSLLSSIRGIQDALDASRSCQTGITASGRAFGVETGPSGGAEILATLYLDDPFWGFWYGHIQQHPEKNGTYVSLIVWTEKFINAGTVPLLFKRFHYWIGRRFFYEPCSIQRIDDAYRETTTIDEAALALIQMIAAFDLDKRSGIAGTGYEDSPVEMRICEVYGLPADREHDAPLLPMPARLAVVRSSGQT